MNIYAEKGHKVVFSNPKAGYAKDQVMGDNHLTVGSTYTIEHTEVLDWSTEVTLREVKGLVFNSVLFEDLKGEEHGTED